ncbi:MAG: transporter [Acidobacteriota bacterium]|nr:transporter [Acidobacteriota bacterium]
MSESATIQRAGGLQLEYGIDANFRAGDYRSQQSTPLGLRFAVTNRLRLDLDLDAITSQTDETRVRATGVGDTTLGFKAIIRDQPKERLALAFAYAVTVPSASAEKNLGTGRVDHNLRFIFNRALGKTDYVVNFSYLNVGREDSDRRASGGQAILTVTRELPKEFGIIGEVYGQSVNESQSRGIYTLAALTYKANQRLQFDAGLRAGFGSDAPRLGIFAGLTVGIADLYRQGK